MTSMTSVESDRSAVVDGDEGRIWFAEFDVLKSCAATLRAAYTRRAVAAASPAEHEWWQNRAIATYEVVDNARERDRDDLLTRCQLLTTELKQIGGLTDGGRV